MGLFDPPKKKKFKKPETEDEIPQEKKHPHYDRNLATAKAFCLGMQPHLYPGVKLCVADSEHLKESLLMISFNPPGDYPCGNYAIPIFLHQDFDEIVKLVDTHYSSIQQMAKNVSMKIKQQEKNENN